MPLTIDYTPINLNGELRAELVARDGERTVHRDTFDLRSGTSRKRFLKDLQARHPGESADKIEQQLLIIADKLDAESRAAASTKGDRPDRTQLLTELDGITAERLGAMSPDLIREAEAMLADPRLVDRILADIAAVGVVGEQELALSAYCIGTSRQLDRTLGGIVQGQSSTGKSFAVESVAKFFPSEAVLVATELTTQALYYMEPGTLIHRLVFAGERKRTQDEAQADATKALREMLSTGQLTKSVTVTERGRPRTMHVYQPGPIAYLESTTLATIFEEDANRCLLLASDESAEQTAAVVAAAAQRAASEPEDVGPIIVKHHAIQRMLRRVKVRIPFAPKLAAAMPKQRPQARRAINHILDMIRAVALLHQRQRFGGIPEHGDTIVAAPFDYVIARRLLVGPLGRALGGELTPAVVHFGQRLRDRYGDDPFTSAQAAKDDPILTARSKANEYLRALGDAGAVECVEDHKGSKPAKWRMTGEFPTAGAAWLPTVEALQ